MEEQQKNSYIKFTGSETQVNFRSIQDSGILDPRPPHLSQVNPLVPELNAHSDLQKSTISMAATKDQI